MMNSSAKKKQILKTAVATAVLAWTMDAGAVDFSIASNQFTICNQSGSGCSTSANGTVSSNGLVTRIDNVPNTGAIGLATFSFSLLARNAVVGDYDFQVHVVISDDNSPRKLEAYLPQLRLSVTADTNGDGNFGVGGHVEASEILHFWADTGSGYQVTGQLENESANMAVLSNGAVVFDAANILDKLANDPTFGAAWQNILDEFDGGGNYSYAIFVKQTSGPGTSRFGTGSGSSFTPLPCATASEIDAWFGPKSTSSATTGGVTVPGSNAYGVQGQFSTDNATGSPGAAPTAFTGCAAPVDSGDGDSDSGGDTDGGSTPPPVVDVDDDLEEIDDILDAIILPGTGEEVDSTTVENVNSAADAALALATQAASGIADGSVPTSQALTVLDTIGNVVDITGTATGNITDGAAAGTTADKGAGSLQGFATVIGSLGDTLTRTSLTPVQKEAVQSSAIKAVVAGVKLLANATGAEVKTSVLQSLGQILSSTINLGVAVTDEQAEALKEAAETGASAGGDVDDALDNSVTIKPEPELISREVLADTLRSAGLDEDEADNILEQLGKAINLSDVALDDTSADNTLLMGLGSLYGADPDTVDPDSVATGVLYDPATGEFSFIPATFSDGIATLKSTTNVMVKLAKADAAPREVPARAISANIVASTFPEGVRVTSNGSVVVTASRIATVVVPTSYDSIYFYADLARLGDVTTGEDGGINIDKDVFPAAFHLSGTFDYLGTITGGEPVARTALTAPASGDESDLDYIYLVTYRDGTQQRLQPYISDDGFIDSIRSHGLSVITNRNTGVVTVNGRQFRPSYFIETPTTGARDFWEDKADSFGLAYRPIDVNQDGVMDYEIISENGAQVAYGLPAQ